MAIFIGFTYLGTLSKGTYPASYVLKSLIVPVALVLLWPKYTRIRWDYWWLGVIVGIVGVVQWVGMEKLLMSQSWLWWTRMSRDVAADAFRPFDEIQPAALAWAFVIIRWAAASLVVPVMEELFWRDLAWRSIAAPNDFKLVEVGEYDPGAFWIVPLIFATVHVQWLTAIVWALMIAVLLVRTRSLGACIIAHGVTNFLLGAYVLHTHEWFFW
jgi:CAAX prenyl protease-like protein